MRKSNQSRTAIRTQSGQAIVEGTAMLMLITAVSVFLLMLGINVYSIVLHDFKVQLIAYEAAKADTESQYWLGMKRSDKSDPGFSPTHTQATEIANTLAKIDGIQIDSVEFSSPDNFKTSVCTIKSPLQLPFGIGVFAGFKVLDRSTQAAATASVQAPPMMVQLNSQYFPNFTSAGSNVTRNASVFIPCYGAATASAAANVNSTFSQVNVTSVGSVLPIGAGIPCPSPSLGSDVKRTVGIMNVGTMNSSGSAGNGFAPIPGDAQTQVATTTTSSPGPNGQYTQPNTPAYGTR